MKVAVVRTDSNTARSLASRRGLGKMRHMELRYLWVQEMVRDGRLKVKRVRGEENPADHLTKPKTFAEMVPMVQAAGGELVHRKGWGQPGQEEVPRGDAAARGSGTERDASAVWVPEFASERSRGVLGCRCGLEARVLAMRGCQSRDTKRNRWLKTHSA